MAGTGCYRQWLSYGNGLANKLHLIIEYNIRSRMQAAIESADMSLCAYLRISMDMAVHSPEHMSVEMPP